MAEEEVLLVPYVDLKRKHEDLESERSEILSSGAIADSISRSEPLELKNSEEEDGKVTNDEASDVSETKRPRLDEKPDVDKDCYQDEKLSFQENKEDKLITNIDELADKQIEEDSIQPQNSKQIASDISEKVEEDIPVSTTINQTVEKQPLFYRRRKSPQVECAKLQSSAKEHETTETSSRAEVPKEGLNLPIMEEQSMPSTQTITRRIEVPNNKVGVLIGKSGDTIRSLQNNSHAKIQITRDIEANPNYSMRPVEIIGTLENINKAEKLIKDVIAEADAGGSPALVARGFNNEQSNVTREQVEIKVPKEKVGFIIGKGGETIKILQVKSGARIQLIQHDPDEGQSNERTLRLTGSKRQIETARERIDEVIAQPVRTSSQSSGGYSSQGAGFRRPPQPGSRGGMHPPKQPTDGYDYNRGPYPNQNQFHPPSEYGGSGYQQQQHGPSRNSYGGPGWDNRPPHDYYYGGGGGGGGGGQADHPPRPPPSSSYGPMRPPPYNYGQDYWRQQHQQQRQPGPYSHGPPPPPPHTQGYGGGQSNGPPPTYGGGYGNQPRPPQTGAGYYPQDQYGKAPPPPPPPPPPPAAAAASYNGQPQGQISGQSYYGPFRGPPAPPSASDNTHQYNQNVYPYGYTQQQGYNQPPPNYGGQQQPVSGGGGYGQQMAYGSYQSSYPEQQPAGAYDQTAYAGGYAQPAIASGQQAGYDQSAQQQQPAVIGNGGGSGAPHPHP